MNIREKIDKLLTEKYYKGLEGVPDYWRVSSIGMAYDAYCRRLKLETDESDTWDIAREQTVMLLGTNIHVSIQNLIKEIPDVEVIGMEEEIKNDELNLVGHYDVYLKFKENNQKIFYDIKTINEKAYTRMAADGERKTGMRVIQPYEHHVKQVLVYDWMLGQEADEIRILYMDRNNGRREEVPIERNEVILQEALDEFRMLNECWENKTPPVEPDIDSWAYKYSKYKNQMNITKKYKEQYGR